MCIGNTNFFKLDYYVDIFLFDKREERLNEADMDIVWPYDYIGLTMDSVVLDMIPGV